MATTARMALRYPAGTDPANVPLDIQELAEDVAARAAMFVRDTLANRPAAGVLGRIFEVTGDSMTGNNGRLFWDTGTTWQEVALLTRALDMRSIPQGEASVALLLNHGYNIHADNVGEGAANNRFWLAGPDQGQVVISTRAGAETLHSILLRANQVQIQSGTPAVPGFAFYGDSDTGILRDMADELKIATGGVVRMAVQSTGIYCTPPVRPSVDNAVSCGVSNTRWTSVWAVNGTIQTSDVRAKEDVQPIPDDTATERVRRVGKEAAISYRWPDGTRRHIGFDAEQVGVIHGETSAAYIDPTYEADARTNPYLGEPTAEWYTDRVDEDDEPDKQAEQRAEAEREWVEAREEFDKETAEIRDAPKGLRPSEMVPDLYAALAKALDRIDQLEARVAALEGA